MEPEAEYLAALEEVAAASRDYYGDPPQHPGPQGNLEALQRWHRAAAIVSQYELHAAATAIKTLAASAGINLDEARHRVFSRAHQEHEKGQQS